MIKKLLSYVRGYWWTTILSPIMVIGEVVLEVFIPLLMANIINIGIPAADLPYILRTGGLMVLMALGALLCGALGGVLAAARLAQGGALRPAEPALFGFGLLGAAAALRAVRIARRLPRRMREM